MARIWSLITGGDDVALYFDEQSRDAAIVDAIKGYKDNPEDFEPEELEQMRADDPDDIALVEVTIDNWRDVLAHLNRQMDEAGEGKYLCELKEHEVPLKLALTLRDGVVEEAQSDSPLLVGMDVALMTPDFDPAVADDQLIDGPAGKLMVTRETVKAADMDLDPAYTIESAHPAPGMR